MCNRTLRRYLGMVSLFYILGLVAALGSIAVARLGL